MQSAVPVKSPRNVGLFEKTKIHFQNTKLSEPVVLKHNEQVTIKIKTTERQITNAHLGNN